MFGNTLNPQKGGPVFLKPASSDILSNVKDTLDKIQDYTPKEYIPALQTMLNTVTELKNSKITNANFTQEITIQGNQVTISWEPYLNNLSHPQNTLMLTFENGRLMFFTNGLSLFKIGNSEINILEQEAIEIAKESARAYPLKYGNGTISNFTILDNPVLTKISLQNKGNTTLYPMWEIWLPLDNMYAGGVTSFHVFVWADTGEVSSITPIGFSGIPPDQQSSPSNSSNASASTVFESISPEYTILAVMALVAAVIIASYLVYKRRKQLGNNL